jgi:hypothetical protein
MFSEIELVSSLHTEMFCGLKLSLQQNKSELVMLKLRVPVQSVS